MNFLNPLFLIGLAAAALPIIIHLINRRRAVRRKFPALEFLHRSKKQLARRLKVRHFLLLLLRVALLMLVPLALAKPYLLSEAGVTEGDRLPKGIIFVVDDSASMAYDQDALWERAVAGVGEEVDALRTWDRAALVYASAWPAGAPLGEDVPIPQLTDDHAEITDLLEDHTPSARSTDIVAALRNANTMLVGSDLPQRQIVLVTDRQASGVDEKALSALALDIPVRVLDVREGEDQPNLAVVGVEYNQQSAGAKPEFEITASVRNFSAEDKKNVEVQLLIDGVHATTSLVDVGAGKTNTRAFSYQFQRKGVHRAELKLGVGADKHAIDNTYHFPIHLAAKVKVLLVNGDRRSVSYQDELFYLERALQPGPRSSSSIVFETIGVEGLASHPFSNYDVVVLANVEKIPRASVGQLKAFAEGGGGVLFTSGSNIKPEVYNSLFVDLLPKPLRSLKVLADPDDPDAPVKLTRFATTDRTHPVFKVFDLPGGESIQSVRVYSYMLLEPTVAGEARNVLALGDGAPALLERQLGEGHVAFLTTTVDRDWTDLPIRTAFLPLMRRYLRYLARRGTSSSVANHFVAHKVNLDIPPDRRARVEVRDPLDGRIVLAPETTDANAPLTFVPKMAGHYRVMATPRSGGAAEELAELAFAVNIDPKESDLRPLPAAELEALLIAGSDTPEGQATIDTPEKRIGIWGIVLFIVTLVLLGETILGTRRSVLLKLWNRVRGKKVDVEKELVG